MQINDNWDLRKLLIEKIKKNGGFVNTHSHIDRAYTIQPQMLNLANEHLHKKWDIVDEIKKNSTVDQIYNRMAFAVEKQIAQGVSVLGSFIDVDEIIEDKAMIAAQKIKDKYSNQIKLVFWAYCQLKPGK